MIHEYNLVPFKQDSNTQDLQIYSKVITEGKGLRVVFEIKNYKENIVLSSIKNSGKREKGLWKQTCFEFFCKNKTEKKYWEWNVASSLSWNVFFFQSYRSAEESEEVRIQTLESYIKKDEDLLCLEFKINLDQILLEIKDLQVSCACVLEHRDGSRSYWAIRHRSDKPDFHALETFVNI